VRSTVGQALAQSDQAGCIGGFVKAGTSISNEPPPSIAAAQNHPTLDPSQGRSGWLARAGHAPGN